MKHITRDMFPETISEDVLKMASIQASKETSCTHEKCTACPLKRGYNNLDMALCSNNGMKMLALENESLVPFARRISQEFLDLVSKPKTVKIDLTE